MRHKHHSVSVYRLQKRQPFVQGGNGINIQSLVCQRTDQSVHMIAIGIEGAWNRGDHSDRGLAGFVNAITLGIGFKIREGIVR